MGLLSTLLLSLLVSVLVTCALSKKIGHRVGWATFLILIMISLALLSLMPVVAEELAISEIFAWVPVANLSFGLLLDGLSNSLLLMLSVVFTAATLFSLPYLKHEFTVSCKTRGNLAYGVYYSFLSLYFLGLMGSLLATNLIQLYLFVEIAVLASWLLIYEYVERKEVALIYFIWTHLGSVALLASVFLTFHTTGSYDVASLHLLANNPVATWVALGILLFCFVKMGAVGLHSWLPITYVSAPPPLSAVIGATSVGLGTYVAIRLLSPIHSAIFNIGGWLELWALLTIIYAGLIALAETDFKRIVTFLSMSQMNYCLLGAFTFMPWGVEGGASYAVSHGLAIALLFLASGAVYHQVGTYDLNKLGGLARRMPPIVIGTMIGFFTIGGVPPTLGFKSKFMLITGAVQRAFVNHSILPLEFSIALLAAIAGILTVAYELWTTWRVFYGSLPEHLREIRPPPILMTIAIFITGITSVAFGIWPAYIVTLIEHAVETLL